MIPSQEVVIRYVVVIDGEHYPPVIESALRDLVAGGDEVVAAVLVGGREKLPAGGMDAIAGAPVLTGPDPIEVMEAAIAQAAPDAVFDLSDEPVLDYRKRFQIASHALALGVPYHGSDFRLDPPPRPVLAAKPSVAVIGTGKRSGKTAVCAFAARQLVELGRMPVIVAMGRGGPPEPEVLRGDQIELTANELLGLADEGRHAASDYIEDALLARVPTVGCRRCGGGVAGAVGFSNVPQGVELANGIEADHMLLEGSGAAIPPVHADTTILVVPATIPHEYLDGYLGHYRMLLADFVVVTMAENPFADPSQVARVASTVETTMGSSRVTQGASRKPLVARTVFRPKPIGSVAGAKAFVATTAPGEAREGIVDHLTEVHGCTVVGISHALSNRTRLAEDLSDLHEADVLLCEIKAAGIDVAARKAMQEGMDVVFMDNEPIGIQGDDPHALVEAAINQAVSVFERRIG